MKRGDDDGVDEVNISTWNRDTLVEFLKTKLAATSS